MVGRIISALERWLFPPACVLDAGPASRFDLADRLVEALQPVGDRPHCSRCAVNLPVEGVCPACLQQPPAFDRVVAAWYLDETLKALLHRLKYGRGDLAITRLLSALSEAPLRRQVPDAMALIPLPLHARRYRQRGFNQAAFLARDWGRAFGLPVMDGLLRRVRDTGQLAGQDRAARWRAMRDAFAVTTDKAPLPPVVALVDDVLTTGSTADAAAAALKAVDPDVVVEVWTVARTPMIR